MSKNIKIWDRANECMSRAALEQLQLRRLQQTVALVEQNVPCYQEKFARAQLSAGDIKTLDDLRRLPFTTKEDLRQNYPYGMFAVPMRDVVRIHSSSGTTGKPTVVGYTRNDIRMWTQMVARFMTAAGVDINDIVHIAFGYGLFTGAFGLHYGTEEM
ncbi:MAG: phenylacetate--CoA ligase, partial [Desulfuromonas sp.]